MAPPAEPVQVVVDEEQEETAWNIGIRGLLRKRTAFIRSVGALLVKWFLSASSSYVAGLASASTQSHTQRLVVLFAECQNYKKCFLLQSSRMSYAMDSSRFSSMPVSTRCYNRQTIPVPSHVRARLSARAYEQAIRQCHARERHVVWRDCRHVVRPRHDAAVPMVVTCCLTAPCFACSVVSCYRQDFSAWWKRLGADCDMAGCSPWRLHHITGGVVILPSAAASTCA